MIIKIIDSETANKIIESREPLGSFLFKSNSDNLWIGIDNEYGNAWVEAHVSRGMILKWLTNRIDLDDLYNK